MEALDLQQLEGLFFALVGIIVVILAILITYVIVANRRQRDRMIAVYEADKLAPRPAITVTGQILSLVRSEVGGPLEVEIDGVKYARLADIEDSQLRRQVVGTALELIQFTGALEPPPQVPVGVEEASSWRENLRESSQVELERIRAQTSGNGSEAEAAQAAGEVEERFLNLLAEMGQPSPGPEKPSVMGALRRRRLPKIPEDDTTPSFVDAIDDIVQRKLRTVPALVGRDLHVGLGDGGSVCFAFEGSKYESLEEIPNLTAQQVVRDAIAEWDEKA
ncbi:MAG: hypothetical protein ACK2UA_19285 [Anaerolineae bacterium]|jgi:hypothetical protein